MVHGYKNTLYYAVNAHNVTNRQDKEQDTKNQHRSTGVNFFNNLTLIHRPRFCIWNELRS
jgi:hypothetical protein